MTCGGTPQCSSCVTSLFVILTWRYFYSVLDVACMQGKKRLCTQVQITMFSQTADIYDPVNPDAGSQHSRAASFLAAQQYNTSAAEAMDMSDPVRSTVGSASASDYAAARASLPPARPGMISVPPSFSLPYSPVCPQPVCMRDFSPLSRVPSSQVGCFSVLPPPPSPF